MRKPAKVSEEARFTSLVQEADRLAYTKSPPDVLFEKMLAYMQGHTYVPPHEARTSLVRIFRPYLEGKYPLHDPEALKKRELLYREALKLHDDSGVCAKLGTVLVDRALPFCEIVYESPPAAKKFLEELCLGEAYTISRKLQRSEESLDRGNGFVIEGRAHMLTAHAMRTWPLGTSLPELSQPVAQEYMLARHYFREALELASDPLLSGWKAQATFLGALHAMRPGQKYFGDTMHDVIEDILYAVKAGEKARKVKDDDPKLFDITRDAALLFVAGMAAEKLGMLRVAKRIFIKALTRERRARGNAEAINNSLQDIEKRLAPWWLATEGRERRRSKD